MTDKSKKFHEFALKHGLFKGRSDWYFCYLKSERIAHVLVVLGQKIPNEGLNDIITNARSLPGDITHVAAGELDVSSVLATVFSLLSSIRLATTSGYLTVDNSQILLQEYEQVAERIVSGSNPSPFATADDFFVPEFPRTESLLLSSRLTETRPHVSPPSIKDISPVRDDKGQNKGQIAGSLGARASLIMEYLRKEKKASIKDITAVIRDCSEKTIQRELGTLIDQGLVRRVGERRWSVYLPV